jgi:hypothetical protein
MAGVYTAAAAGGKRAGLHYKQFGGAKVAFHWEIRDRHPR